MTIPVHGLIRLPRLPGLVAASLAFGALALGACSGGVVVDRDSTGAGGSGAASAASSGGNNAGGASVSSAVQSSANSTGASASTSASGGGGAGGGWPKKEICFIWEPDAGPCPPKEEAADHMSMCGFSVFSVDEGPFVKGNQCCYFVSGVPNPC